MSKIPTPHWSTFTDEDSTTWQPMILTFVFIANELGVLAQLTKAEGPLSGAVLAESTKADPVLLSKLS